jgi:DNA-binding MarR family transcriptional regulator
LHFREIVNGFKIHDALCANDPGLDVSIQELHVIELLGDLGPQMMRELSDRLLVAVNTITNIVDHLERKHFAERIRSTEDRRVIHVSLTEKGKKMYEAFTGSHIDFCSKMLRTLNEDEQDILMVLMRKIARSASKRPPEDQGSDTIVN